MLYFHAYVLCSLVPLKTRAECKPKNKKKKKKNKQTNKQKTTHTRLFTQHLRKIKNLSFVICFFRSGFPALTLTHHPIFHHKYPLCVFFSVPLYFTTNTTLCIFFFCPPLPPMVKGRSTNRFLSLHALQSNWALRER